MERLLLFTIGSVQEYIIESKKVVDLINSSSIISYLMENLKNYIKNKMDGEILLPYIESSKSGVNISNQILVTYESDSSMAIELEYSVKDSIYNLITKANKTNKNKLSGKLEDMVNTYWVEIPIYNEDEYEEKYIKLCSYLEAIKHTNKFINTSNKDYIKGAKCSICGKRNWIFNKNDDKRIKDKEELCGVCYLKRIYECINVDSTAQIALKKWIKKNRDKNEYETLMQEIKKIVKFSRYGQYQLLYKENMINELKNLNLKEDIEHINNLYEKLSKNQEKYYCIYRLDIDSLGKWISGQYKKDNSNLKDYQRNLSKKIHIFLSKIVNFFSDKENDILVYAGGDDVLALLNLEDAFKLSIEVNDYLKNIFNGSLFKNISFSQGIFIVHYKDTLRESLKLTKARLDAVKEKFERLSYKDEKNALLISVLTDGYFYKEFHFKNNFESKYIVKEINNLLEYFRKESSFFHNELTRKFEYMDFDYNNDLYIQDDVKNMLIVEQRRLMKRSNRNGEVNKYIEQLLVDIFNNNKFEMDLLDIENYLNMFYIIEKIQNILGGDEYDESIKSNS